MLKVLVVGGLASVGTGSRSRSPRSSASRLKREGLEGPFAAPTDLYSLHAWLDLRAEAEAKKRSP